ncbi:restriction endonuclease [Rhizorhapis sp. SPR117]|uniref:restriction endonuclease n=1 Tax=Rhizorhapis sp. SPR117 TaxID=2912611 RepID=UPI001F481331|nr:restriction endonuclease [Rhizorhapis sp. SPR117]
MMFRSKYDRAVKAGFDVPRPRMVDYGFPASFMRNTFEAEQQSKRTNAAIKAFVISAIYTTIVTYFVAVNFFPNVLENPSDNKWPLGSIAGLSLWLIFGYVKAKLDNTLNNDEEVQRLAAYDAAQAAWEAKCDDWMESQLETGLVFWREMRGVDLERALMRLFQKRGCEVETTKVSGDGGVDLVVKIGDAVMWRQCKGHATPISVAPIREIAGVCSRSNAHPVVFAVNGFTKPAQDTAKALGVQLFDAHHIVALARRSNLTDLAQANDEAVARG